jgi:hypothetical protein
MNKAREAIRIVASVPGTQFSVQFKRLVGLIVVAMAVGVCGLWAAEPEDEYLSVLNLIQQADGLNASGTNSAALAQYRKAQTALNAFQRGNPGWNSKIVSYRVNYLAEKISVLSGQTAAPAVTESDAKSKQSNGTTGDGAGKVKLIDAGGEPRQVLRLHPKPGDKQSVSMAVRISIATKMGEMEMPAMKMPAMSLPMETTVKDVSAEGDISYEMVMGECTVADEPGTLPQVAAAMKSAANSLKGLAGTCVVSSRGLDKGRDFKAPAGADAQTLQMMEQMKQGLSGFGLPLPEEAIGPGAKWEFKQPLKSQGMTLTQTFEYQLASADGDHVVASSKISQTAPQQKIENPAMPGLKVDLNKMSGTGKGDVTVDLGQLLPVKGNTDMHSEMSMGVNTGGQKQAMSMTMDVGMSFETK